MSALYDLIAQITDPRLRERLAAEWAKAAQDRKFGLVFENHLPELLPLYGAQPRRGDWVCRKSGPLQKNFINTQKLGNDKRLTKVSDGRQYSLWTKLSNTAQVHPDRFYVVIDEAHRGMASGRGAKADTSVVGWLRNVDRKPWSLEIPYHTGGAARPMFPDLVMVRQTGADFAVDILEPHDPSLADNFEKAAGLARFAEQQGHLFGRIQLIRKQTSPAGGECFARLEINRTTTIKQLLLITSNPQLDQLFAKLAK